MTKTTTSPTKSYAETYPDIPISCELLLSGIYSNEELGLLCKASALFWRDQLPDDPMEAAEALGIPSEQWTERATQIMWHSFMVGAMGWMRRNKHLSFINSENSKKRQRDTTSNPQQPEPNSQGNAVEVSQEQIDEWEKNNEENQ
jgi:hypothetical protein